MSDSKTPIAEPEDSTEKLNSSNGNGFDTTPQVTPFGIVKPTSIIKEMEKSYVDYAMSVIVSRALPDVRDGLKPVHRRILFAMKEMGLTHKKHIQKICSCCWRSPW